MNDVLKQRLVGALILVALGVVFWPIIFVEPDSDSGVSEARIPPRPNIDTTPLPSPDRVGLRASRPLHMDSDPALDANSVTSGDERVEDPNTATIARQSEAGEDEAQRPVDEDALPEPASPVARPNTSPEPEAVAKQTRDKSPAQPTIDAQGVPVAWMLQVISVSRKDSAEQTRQRLQDMGHKAYIKAGQANGKTVYRVYVGPKFERAKLDALKADVDRQFGVKSMIRRYLP